MYMMQSNNMLYVQYHNIMQILLTVLILILQELSSSECKSFSSLPRQVAPHCRFSTITVNGGRLATVLAENPAGCVLTLDHKLLFQKWSTCNIDEIIHSILYYSLWSSYQISDFIGVFIIMTLCISSIIVGGAYY